MTEATAEAVIIGTGVLVLVAIFAVALRTPRSRHGHAAPKKRRGWRE